VGRQSVHSTEAPETLSEKVQIAQQRLADFIDTASEMFWETDEHLRIVEGWSTADQQAPSRLPTHLIGKTIQEIAEQDSRSPLAWKSPLTALEQRRPFRGLTFSVRTRDNGTLWLEANGNPCFDPQGRFRGYRGTCRDITERKMVEAQVAFMSRHDGLTRLPNRTLLRERIQLALAQAARGVGFAVMCLDLDHFKLINDTLGHPTGDALLLEAAIRLQACVRETDTVARLGGDEFAIVQTGVEKPEDANLLAQRIVESISQPYEFGDDIIIVGATIGVAVAPSNGGDPDLLLKNADIALYRAKQDGRGGICFFEHDMDARLQARRSLETELRTALAAGEFRVFYQPVVYTQSGEISCFEALVRWHHPTRGVVSPADFIPVAEESGLIRPIGEWVLQQACLDAASWPEHIKVAVNLSPAQFKSRNLGQSVREALRKSGLPGHRLELEITEAVLMQNTKATVEALHELRELGTVISMDDFGTGYSSLSYLRSFPFDKLKIDRSFIRDLTNHRGALAIVRAIAALGSSLGLATTAEGVETREQFDAVRAEGCTEVQGYLFSPPVPAEQLQQFLRVKGLIDAGGCETEVEADQAKLRVRHQQNL
jgi:diguanylate cyclase (GGDEF)-like protein/PAS domain S-box-containing protein